MIHIAGSAQTTVIHIITYGINGAFFAVMLEYGRKWRKSSSSVGFLVWLGALVCFDIFAFWNLSIVYYISSQAAIFLSILKWNGGVAIHMWQMRLTYPIVICIGGVLTLFVIETQYCREMLMWWDLPYHGAIELVGILLFLFICDYVILL